MPNEIITVTTELDIPIEPNDLIRLTLVYGNKKSVRGQLTGNGEVNNMFVADSKGVDATSLFLGAEVENLASLFDPTASIANSIDGLWLVTELLAKNEKDNGGDHDLAETIKRLTVVHNLMALYAVGGDVMVKLYGYNWVVESSATFIKKSKKWTDLIARITAAKEGLAAALSA